MLLECQTNENTEAEIIEEGGVNRSVSRVSLKEGMALYDRETQNIGE
jgi:hypothetical protein